jgi:hypothetical protein
VIDIDKLDYNKTAAFSGQYLPKLVLMTSVLASVVVNLPDQSSWHAIFKKVLAFVGQALEKATVGEELLFSLVHLASFGFFCPSPVVFPFAPSFTKAQDCVPFAITQGQVFPSHPPSPSAFPKFEPAFDRAALSEKVRLTVHQILPRHIKILPGVSMDVPREDAGLYSRAVEANQGPEWPDWPSFILSIRKSFGLDENCDFTTVFESEVWRGVTYFLARFLLKYLNDPVLVPRIFLLNNMVNSQYCVMFMYEMTYSVLKEMDKGRIFSLPFFQFTCERWREGWFSKMQVKVLDLLFRLVSVTGEPPPDCLLDSIIDGFDLIDPDHFQRFLYLFKLHRKCVFHEAVIERDRKSVV